MSDEKRSYAVNSILVGDDCRVRLNTYGDNPPILAIDAGSIGFNISIMRRTVDESAVEFARAFARAAQAFATEVERFRAECATSGITDIPDLAA